MIQKIDSKQFLAIFLLLLLFIYFAFGHFCTPPSDTHTSLPDEPAPKKQSPGGEKIKLYYSMTCPHSRRAMETIEKEGLVQHFELIDCQKNRDACKGISSFPTYEVNGQKSSGYRNSDEIRQMLAAKQPPPPNNKSGGKKIKLYYSMTCPHSRRAMDTIEKEGLVQHVELIDCQKNKDACQGISGVPTYEVNGLKKPGYRNADEIRQMLK